MSYGERERDVSGFLGMSFMNSILEREFNGFLGLSFMNSIFRS